MPALTWRPLHFDCLPNGCNEFSMFRHLSHRCFLCWSRLNAAASFTATTSLLPRISISSVLFLSFVFYFPSLTCIINEGKIYDSVWNIFIYTVFISCTGKIFIKMKIRLCYFRYTARKKRDLCYKSGLKEMSCLAFPNHHFSMWSYIFSSFSLFQRSVSAVNKRRKLGLWKLVLQNEYPYIVEISFKN